MASVTISEKKSKAIGIAFFTAFVALLIFYIAHLTGPVQSDVVEARLEGVEHSRGFVTSFLGAFITSFTYGIVLATLSFLGYTFVKPSVFGATSASFDWYDIFLEKSYWIWAIIFVIATVGLTYVWRADL